MTSSPIHWSPQIVTHIPPVPVFSDEEEDENVRVYRVNQDPEQQECEDTPPAIFHAEDRTQSHTLTLQPAVVDLEAVDCSKVQQLDQALASVHEKHPYLKPVEQGKVYDMAPILEGIEKLEADSGYKLRKKERHDYKHLHSHGKSERR